MSMHIEGDVETGEEVPTPRSNLLGSAALHQAILQGDLELVKYLLLQEGEKSVNLHFQNGVTPLNAAIGEHQEALAHFLLDAGADPFLADSFRLDGCERQPIHYAAACDMLSILKVNMRLFKWVENEANYSTI